MNKKILVLLGSIKTNSTNQKIVEYFAEKTADFFDVETYPLSNLPYFNPDLEMVGFGPFQWRPFGPIFRARGEQTPKDLTVINPKGVTI